MTVPPNAVSSLSRSQAQDPRSDGASTDLIALSAARENERFALHSKYLNEMWVRVLKTIGYDVGFTRGVGAYLYDRAGDRYLDLLSGWGVFAIGRNHPTVRDALISVLDGDLPNLVQTRCFRSRGRAGGAVARAHAWLDKAFFANSGAEAVEAAIKFARYATGRSGIVHCAHAFHGLTYGALSINGDRDFQTGLRTTRSRQCAEVPFDDLAALEEALRRRDVAAFFVEPIQGKGVNIPHDDYLQGVAELCRKYGTLFVADEIQTGVGRTGKFLAIDHYGVEPDMVVLAKALSGGHVPVGVGAHAQMDFRQGIRPHGPRRRARLDLRQERSRHGGGHRDAGCARTGKSGRECRRAGRAAARVLPRDGGRYELVADVRGKGLMIGIEFGAPKSFKLKAAWNLLETVNSGLFCQLISIPLFQRSQVLTQVAGHGNHTIKLLPPLNISDADCDWIETLLRRGHRRRA